MQRVQVIADHIHSHLANSHKSPIFVALQGPQGSGKTYLTDQLRDVLQAASFRVAILSIDDLYLPHSGLMDLANSQPKNPLWSGRGQPGTHDVELGIQILDSLKKGDVQVEIPQFDKSLFNGEGDRLAPGKGTIVHPPVDVVLMEGWCMGFYPISREELDRRWETSWVDESRKLGLRTDLLGTKEDIARVNNQLHDYVRIWSYFDVFVQLSPAQTDASKSPLSVVYQWRLQQEHHMKSQNGGRGMTDEAVKLFIDRYMPGYIYFGDGVRRGYQPSDCTATSPTEGTAAGATPPWIGSSLSLLIDNARELLSVEYF